MHFDRLVHDHPEFYQWKLEVIKIIKRTIFKMIFLDKKIMQVRREIEIKNRELIKNYFYGKRVLEVGCGQGSFLASLSRNYNCDCVGIDISEKMIGSANEKNLGPQYFVMDGGNLKFKDNEFDIIVFNYVLHHTSNLDKTIAEAKRVGKIIIFYESCTWERQPFKALSKAYWKLTDGGYNYLSLNEWQGRFALPVLDEIRGNGLVRYGMCVLRA